MGKVRMTAKEIRNTGDYCVKLGYCEAQHLLSVLQPIGYTAGVYGWNFDVYYYMVNGRGVWICTGYRGMVGERLAEDVKPYDDEARKILSDWSKGYDDRRNEVFELIDRWLTKGLFDETI